MRTIVVNHGCSYSGNWCNVTLSITLYKPPFSPILDLIFTSVKNLKLAIHQQATNDSTATEKQFLNKNFLSNTYQCKSMDNALLPKSLSSSLAQRLGLSKQMSTSTQPLDKKGNKGSLSGPTSVRPLAKK